MSAIAIVSNPDAWVSGCKAAVMLGYRGRRHGIERILKAGGVTVKQLPGGGRPSYLRSDIEALANESVKPGSRPLPGSPGAGEIGSVNATSFPGRKLGAKSGATSADVAGLNSHPKRGKCSS